MIPVIPQESFDHLRRYVSLEVPRFGIPLQRDTSVASHMTPDLVEVFGVDLHLDHLDGKKILVPDPPEATR